jgi:hypothetical protein
LRIRGLFRDWKADIVCLLETKLEYIYREVMSSLWACQHMDWTFLGLRGALGGILLIWDRQAVEKTEDCARNFSVVCSFRNVINNFVWAFARCMVQMMMV